MKAYSAYLIVLELIWIITIEHPVYLKDVAVPAGPGKLIAGAIEAEDKGFPYCCWRTIHDWRLLL